MEHLKFDSIPPTPENKKQNLAWNALVALAAHGDRLADAATPVRDYVQAGYSLDVLLAAAGYRDSSELRFARIALGFRA